MHFKWQKLNYWQIGKLSIEQTWKEAGMHNLEVMEHQGHETKKKECITKRK